MWFQLAFLLTAAAFSFAVPPKFIRPCYLDDYDCIKANLAVNFDCNPDPFQPVPKQYRIARAQAETPYFNATYIDTNLITRNHHRCFVSEFYYNLQSDSAVLTLDCPHLNFESTRTLIQHQSFREDTLYNYKINGTYPLVRLTTVLKPTIGLCRAFTFADVTALPIFTIDPNDQLTANFLSKDLTSLNIFEREYFFYRASWLAKFYINRALCDFGCDY